MLHIVKFGELILYLSLKLFTNAAKALILVDDGIVLGAELVDEIKITHAGALNKGGLRTGRWLGLRRL